MTDQDYMTLALGLAAMGTGWTSPNPMVGAVIVKNGRILAQGWHHRCGEPHAERDALANCHEDPKGSTMYVTLEPCCHTGRQPPCVDAILEAGIARVVVGSPDPNPKVAGKGVEILRSHGVQVEVGVMQKECDRLNEVFLHYIQSKRPFVVMKYAMTLDGKIACCTGASKWVTGQAAREHVQTLRHKYRAIMVGVGTVLADDPLLTCRIEGGRNPIRVICDSRLRTPLGSQIVRTAKDVPTILATCCTDEVQQKPFREAGCDLIVTSEKDGHVDLEQLMNQLGSREIDSVLLEGGGTLNWAALESGIVCKVLAYVAPKLFGGRDAKTPVEGDGFPDPSKAVLLKQPHITQLGEDFLIESEVDGHVHGNC